MSDFLIGLITVLIYVAVVMTWFFTLADLFARGDVHGWAKGLWLLAVVFIPLIGVVAYWVIRPKVPISELWWGANKDIYAQRDDSVRLRVDTLTRMRDDGTISDEEFTRMKEKVVT